jgi:hypothetical protein
LIYQNNLNCTFRYQLIFLSWTGAGRYVPSGSAATTTSASKYFPQTNPVRIEQANIKGIVGKFK